MLTPSHGAWKRAAGALTQLVRERKVSPGKGITKSLVNDCIIAASARDHGFTLVTDNIKDFGLIQSVLPLDSVPPWPLWS